MEKCRADAKAFLCAYAKAIAWYEQALKGNARSPRISPRDGPSLQRGAAERELDLLV